LPCHWRFDAILFRLRSESLMNVIYARYNRHRLPPFQIETLIVEENGAKTVIKKALTPEAAGHIQAISSGYDLIQSKLNSGSLVLPRRTAVDVSSISFEYIDGKSLDHLLFQSFRDKDKTFFFKIIDDYCALLKKSFRFVEQPEISPKIGEIFGLTVADRLGNGNGWLPLAAIDAVFENIIVSGGKHYLIDNEWVFAGALPAAFVVFRSLFYFHKVKYFEIGIEQWVPFEELLERCQINPASARRYQEMDNSFQAYVYGTARCYQYKENYKKRQVAVHALEQTIDHQRAVVRKYHGDIVTMRGALSEKDRIINEIVNSFGWRLWRKVAYGIDRLCPAGSRRRRAADRLISTLK